jgi:hypothetical protein
MKARETDDSTVGKKYRARRNTLVRVFRCRARASTSDRAVRPITTARMNWNELTTAVVQTLSPPSNRW